MGAASQDNRGIFHLLLPLQMGMAFFCCLIASQNGFADGMLAISPGTCRSVFAAGIALCIVLSRLLPNAQCLPGNPYPAASVVLVVLAAPLALAQVPHISAFFVDCLPLALVIWLLAGVALGGALLLSVAPWFKAFSAVRENRLLMLLAFSFLLGATIFEIWMQFFASLSYVSIFLALLICVACVQASHEGRVEESPGQRGNTPGRLRFFTYGLVIGSFMPLFALIEQEYATYVCMGSLLGGCVLFFISTVSNSKAYGREEERVALFFTECCLLLILAVKIYTDWIIIVAVASMMAALCVNIWEKGASVAKSNPDSSRSVLADIFQTVALGALTSGLICVFLAFALNVRDVAGIVALVMIVALLVNYPSESRVLKAMPSGLMESAEKEAEGSGPLEKGKNRAQYYEMLLDGLDGADSLTEREREIAHLLARGYNTERIASILFISSSTARTHVSHAYQKIGVSGQQELIDAIEQAAKPGTLGEEANPPQKGENVRKENRHGGR